MNNYVFYLALCPLVTFWVMMQIAKSDDTKLSQLEARNWFGLLLLSVIWPITISFLGIVFFVEGAKKRDVGEIFDCLTKERGVPPSHIVIGGADQRVRNQLERGLEPMTVSEIIGNRQILVDRIDRATEEMNAPDQFPIVAWKNDDGE
jgi:hypothetical protein